MPEPLQLPEKAYSYRDPCRECGADPGKPPAGPCKSHRYYIAKSGRGSCFLTCNGAGASYGPYTLDEAQDRLDGMGIG